MQRRRSGRCTERYPQRPPAPVFPTEKEKKGSNVSAKKYLEGGREKNGDGKGEGEHKNDLFFSFLFLSWKPGSPTPISIPPAVSPPSPGGRGGGWRSLFFGVGAMHKSRGEKKKKEKGGETAASRRKEGRESESWKKRYF